jgi:uncharacterized protein
MTSLLYHDGNRALQDEFGSRPLADRLEERLTRTAFSADDKSYIESCLYFFQGRCAWLRARDRRGGAGVSRL